MRTPFFSRIVAELSELAGAPLRRCPPVLHGLSLTGTLDLVTDDKEPLGEHES